MTTEFLDSRNSITQKISDLFQNSRDIRCIVAFWGKGALELFAGMDDERLRKVKIVCNLTTGGTNPSVIQELLNKNIAVRHNPTLHSKVYWTDRGVIVGSANASANGLSLESVAQDGWLEAGVHSNRQSTIEKVKLYVDEIWGKAKKIRPKDLEEAKRNWRKRRPFPRPDETVHFVHALRNGAFTDRVTPVWFSIDVESAGKYQADIQERGNQLCEQYVELHERELDAWVWEDPFRLPREVYFISFFLGKRGRLYFTKIWKTLPRNCDKDGLDGYTYQYAYAVPDAEIGMTISQRKQMTALIQDLAVNHASKLTNDLRTEGCYIPIEKLLKPRLRKVLTRALQETNRQAARR